MCVLVLGVVICKHEIADMLCDHMPTCCVTPLPNLIPCPPPPLLPLLILLGIDNYAQTYQFLKVNLYLRFYLFFVN